MRRWHRHSRAGDSHAKAQRPGQAGHVRSSEGAEWWSCLLSVHFTPNKSPPNVQGLPTKRHPSLRPHTAPASSWKPAEHGLPPPGTASSPSWPRGAGGRAAENTGLHYVPSPARPKANREPECARAGRPGAQNSSLSLCPPGRAQTGRNRPLLQGRPGRARAGGHPGMSVWGLPEARSRGHSLQSLGHRYSRSKFMARR